MKSIYQLDLPTEKRELAERVNATMGADCVQGYILWDDQNYPDHPNPLYRRNAFHMNIASGGIEEASPDHILTLMAQPDCKHLVWISRAIGEAEPIRLVWVYAHEMRHLAQDIETPLLSNLTNFLTSAYPRIEPPKLQIEIPGEFDAELTARNLVIELFGPDQFRSYVSREIQQNPRAAEYFRRFEEIEGTWSGNPMEESVRILCRHMEAFKQELQSLRGSGYNWSFDIDALCRTKAGA